MVSADENGKPIVDAQGEFILASDLEAAVHKAFKSGGLGKSGVDHEKFGRNDIVEMFVVTKAKRQALGFGDGPEGLVLTVQINNDEDWESVQKQERMEFSVFGRAIKTPRQLTEFDIESIDLVDMGASGNAENRPKIVLAKRYAQEVEKQMTIEEILAKLSPEERAVVEEALKGVAAKEFPPKKEEEPKPEELMKSMPAPVRKAYELAMQKAAEAEEVSKKAAVVLEAAELKEFVAKSADLKVVGASNDELGKALQQCAKRLDASQFATIEKVLKSCGEVVSKSDAFKEIGSAGNGAGGDPKAQLESVAKSLMAKDPKLTHDRAILEAAKQNPDLEAAYFQNQGAK